MTFYLLIDEAILWYVCLLPRIAIDKAIIFSGKAIPQNPASPICWISIPQRLFNKAISRIVPSSAPSWLVPIALKDKAPCALILTTSFCYFLSDKPGTVLTAGIKINICTRFNKFFNTFHINDWFINSCSMHFSSNN